VRVAEPAPAAATPWAEIARPTRPSRLAGVTMAGFRGRGADVVDYLAVPPPAVMLAVEFGDGRLVIQDAACRKRRGSLAAGLAPGAARVRARGGVGCVQVRLAPAAALAVLGVPLVELSHTVVTLADLWGQDVARIEEQLHQARSWEHRFGIIDAALARRRDAGPPVAAEVAVAWERIVTSSGQIRVDQLAGEVGWSRQRLWSRFHSQVGLTPKRATRLVRFDRAAHRLAAGASPARVAAEGGYADQSHLHREVRDFVEMTPTVVADQPWLAVDDVAWPDHPPAVPSSAATVR
jgi:AraC-like DNA-binding protein